MKKTMAAGSPDWSSEKRPLVISAQSSNCGVLQCVAVCCSVMQCDTVCCRVLQCVAVCCSVIQCVAGCSSSNCPTDHMGDVTYSQANMWDM
jgi:hypothetical protein